MAHKYSANGVLIKPKKETKCTVGEPSSKFLQLVSIFESEDSDTKPQFLSQKPSDATEVDAAGSNMTSVDSMNTENAISNTENLERSNDAASVDEADASRSSDDSFGGDGTGDSSAAGVAVADVHFLSQKPSDVSEVDAAGADTTSMDSMNTENAISDTENLERSDDAASSDEADDSRSGDDGFGGDGTKNASAAGVAVANYTGGRMEQRKQNLLVVIHPWCMLRDSGAERRSEFPPPGFLERLKAKLLALHLETGERQGPADAVATTDRWRQNNDKKKYKCWIQYTAAVAAAAGLGGQCAKTIAGYCDRPAVDFLAIRRRFTNVTSSCKKTTG